MSEYPDHHDDWNAWLDYQEQVKEMSEEIERLVIQYGKRCYEKGAGYGDENTDAILRKVIAALDQQAARIADLGAALRGLLEMQDAYHSSSLYNETWVCDFCDGEGDEYVTIQHMPDCPVVAARQALGEQAARQCAE